MSTIKVDTVQSTGGGAVTLTKQFANKSWANLNGAGTIALRDSFNIASTLDNGTGNYDIVFTNNMSDANYAVVGESAHDAPISGGRNRHYHCVGESSSQININGYTTSQVDINFCYASSLGDLA